MFEQHHHLNPLLKTLSGPNELPVFNAILPEHIEPAIDFILESNQKTLEAFLNSESNPSFENIIPLLEQMAEHLNQIWNIVSHLNAVKNSEKLFEAYEKSLAKISEYETKLNQHEGLYKVILAISKKTQHKIIENTLLDFKLSGIDLKDEQKQLFEKITLKITELESQFEQNLLHATDSFELWIPLEEKQKTEGIPESSLEEASKKAAAKSRKGWLFTLDYPSYHAVITYANDRSLRRTLYEAYVSRASEIGPQAGLYDNSPIMLEILQLRQKIAALLGFNNYAEVALKHRVAKKPEEVITFLNNLVQHAKPKGVQELKNLKAFAKERFQLETLEPWDIPYYSEKMLQENFELSEEVIRQYFPVTKVLQGLFDVASKLFNITFKEIKQFEKWHEQVQLFEVYTDNQELCGKFYLDLYARPNKRGGAWVSDYKRRFSYLKNDKRYLQYPISFLTTNFSSPTDSSCSYLTHDEVITLFHEFGHCLHHVLTQVDFPSISGTSGVELDAVEFPSQFLENWCWEKESLKQLSAHVKTGKSLPDDLIDKMNAAKNFQSGMQLLRQLEFSLFDFKINQNTNIQDLYSLNDLLSSIRKEVAIVPLSPLNRFPNSFYHSFGGDYAAGYYSYAWAEVMSCDAFETFKQLGIYNASLGKKLLSTVLQCGGSKPAIVLYEAFQGRKPEFKAFLKYYGLSDYT